MNLHPKICLYTSVCGSPFEISKRQIFRNRWSRNLLDSAEGGTFMEINLGEATKLLDNIMANYSQWHIDRSSTNKKCLLFKKLIL